MAFANRQPAPPESSVTVGRNARGVIQFEVTVRHESAVTARDVAAALADELISLYPYPDTNGGKS
jgi:hypothetical protein